jgi:bifunctional DNA-binding transcriptional regulator/antitoxin component of YhaV-PrlF toxin-antitoxin module
MYARKLRYGKGSYFITVPKEIVSSMNWSEGDEIIFEPNGKGVLLRKNEFKRAIDLIQQGEIREAFTIGYEGKDIEEFIEELIENGVERLIDVREMPLSRKNGFSKKSLMKALREAGIEYKPFPELGAPKEARHDLKSRILDFEEFAEIYRRHLINHVDDLKALEIYVSSKKSAIMCFEADWRKCHRSIIAEFLEQEGFEVIHL